MITCEVCVEGYPGAVAAARGGAHRIELCSGLVEGGTTPSFGTLRAVVEKVETRTVVLVRPRGGDFLYTPEELEVMIRDVGHAREVGVFGVATGALTADGEVDEEAMEKIMEEAGELSVTFHRAFDMVRDPWQALETLIDLGVHRILTSGGARTVPEGLGLIGALVREARGRLSIMPGGGLTERNVREVVQATSVGEVHFTASRHWESPMTHRNPAPRMGASRLPGEYERSSTSPERVRQVMEALTDLQ